MKSVSILPSCLAIASLLLLSAPVAVAAAPSAPVEPHKVYADYHNARFTREHDGAVGLWSYTTIGRSSRVPNPVVNRNADLIDADGRHQLASVDYPLVGMQSELDPDYLEYQVLSAKAANIDGFFVEWGYREHTSELVRQALTAVAARYDFEIGINLCDHWLFSQLPAKHPELKSRAQLVAEFERNYAYLVKSQAAAPNAVRFDGRPVVLLFGGGLEPEEFGRVHQAAEQALGRAPCVLIRPLVSGRPGGADGVIQTWDRTPWYSPDRGFYPGIAGFFGWVPTRARTDGRGPLRSQFDRYGTIDDARQYLELITAAGGNGPRVSSATPGFDNRACAGWGSDFSLLERGHGELYRAMWTFACAHANRIDWVFLPTWNDWTEGSHIEPSVEDRGLFLQLTAAAAAKFKGVRVDPALTELPARLFALRMRLRRLAQIGCGETTAPLGSALDAAALSIAHRDGTVATAALDRAAAAIAAREQQLPPPREIVLSARGDVLMSAAAPVATPSPANLPLRLRLEESTAARLRQDYYEAVLEFDYRPTQRGRLEIVTDTSRAPSAVGNFGVVAAITLLGPGEWQHGRVDVFAANCAWQHRLGGGYDLEFRGAAEVKNVRLVAHCFDRAQPAEPVKSP